jgi:Uma2 family endonuclease
MQLNIRQLVIPSGHQALLKDIDWQEFEQILEELNETRTSPRLSYSEGWLELMSPLAVHEDDKNIISDLIKIMLEEQGIEFRALGSITLKNDRLRKAVEPDECFYIQHEALIRGKDRIDLGIDPPPDLVIEIDITHRSHFDNYQSLGVPELWRYNGSMLDILILDGDSYRSSEASRQFPRFPIRQVIPEYLAQSKVEGRNKTMQAFRSYVREVL